MAEKDEGKTVRGKPYSRVANAHCDNPVCEEDMFIQGKVFPKKCWKCGIGKVVFYE